MPDAVPTQSMSAESVRTQFTFWEGKPSRIPSDRQCPPASELSPFGVANHIVSPEVSAIDVTESEVMPDALVYVVKWPLRNWLTPPLKVPAQTVPSRLCKPDWT